MPPVSAIEGPKTPAGPMSNLPDLSLGIPLTSQKTPDASIKTIKLSSSKYYFLDRK